MCKVRRSSERSGKPILDRSSPYDSRIRTEPNPKRTDLGEAARQCRLKVLAMLVTHERQRREAVAENVGDAGPGFVDGHARREDVGHPETRRRAVSDCPGAESVRPVRSEDSNRRVTHELPSKGVTRAVCCSPRGEVFLGLDDAPG